MRTYFSFDKKDVNLDMKMKIKETDNLPGPDTPSSSNFHYKGDVSPSSYQPLLTDSETDESSIQSIELIETVETGVHFIPVTEFKEDNNLKKDKSSSLKFHNKSGVSPSSYQLLLTDSEIVESSMQSNEFNEAGPEFTGATEFKEDSMLNKDKPSSSNLDKDGISPGSNQPLLTESETEESSVQSIESTNVTEFKEDHNSKKNVKSGNEHFSFSEQKGNDYNRIPPPLHFTFSDEDDDNTVNKIKRKSNIISNATPPRDFNARKFEFLRTGLASTISNPNNQRLITNRFSSFSLPVSSTNSAKQQNLTSSFDSPMRTMFHNKSKQAHAVITRQTASLRKRRLLLSQRKSRLIVIPANHPYKIIWDVVTIILTFASMHSTHQSIRDKNFDFTPSTIFTQIWFVIDILLNFITEHESEDGRTVLRSSEAVWGRYLTTWFVVDAVSLIPWERLFVKPIVDMQRKRNFFTKSFFRTKSFVKVTRILRANHVRLFGKMANNTKYIGVGTQRLLKLMIKYAPKYLLFYRNMKAVLFFKVLRQIHFIQKVAKGMYVLDWSFFIGNSVNDSNEDILDVIEKEDDKKLINLKNEDFSGD